jgi:hypothetical protein
MKKMKYSKITIVAVTIIAVILLSSPSVFAGAFKLNIYPPTTPISPGIEMREIEGVHQNIPTIIDNILPSLWASQYTFIEVAEKPSWASVTFPDSSPITPPDSVEYELKGIVAVSEDAPAYEFGTVKLSITTGKFARTIVPWIPGLGNEFNMDQSFQIQAGYLPLLTATNPPAKEGSPNTNIAHELEIVNTGNARSLIQFRINNNEIPDGWSISTPAAIFLDPDETVKIPVDVYTPRTFGYTDEWSQIPMDINVRSVVEPSGATANYTVTLSSHCIGYYAPVPGGNNPAMLFGAIIGIIVAIIVVIVLVVKLIRKPSSPSLVEKLKKRKGSKKENKKE